MPLYLRRLCMFCFVGCWEGLWQDFIAQGRFSLRDPNQHPPFHVVATHFLDEQLLEAVNSINLEKKRGYQQVGYGLTAPTPLYLHALCNMLCLCDLTWCVLKRVSCSTQPIIFLQLHSNMKHVYACTVATKQCQSLSMWRSLCGECQSPNLALKKSSESPLANSNISYAVQVVLIGCGFDTRPFRWDQSHLLSSSVYHVCLHVC